MAAQAQGRKKKEHHEEHADERWLLTYADMITLLMVLFIVMFAISQVDQKKFAELSGGLAVGFGGEAPGLPGGMGVLPGDNTATGDAKVSNAAVAPSIAQAASTGSSPAAAAAAADRAELARARDALQAALEAAGASGRASLELTERGLVVTLVTDEVLFPSGQAVLSQTGHQVLDVIAPALRSLPNAISVEGHTDDVPVSGTYASNWELSSARATSVVRHLIEVDRLAPGRLSATGYADQKPMVPMDSDAHRARNRRVEVVVLAQPSSIAPDLAPDLTPSADAGAAPAAPAVAPDLAPKGGH